MVHRADYDTLLSVGVKMWTTLASCGAGFHISLPMMDGRTLNDI